MGGRKEREIVWRSYEEGRRRGDTHTHSLPHSLTLSHTHSHTLTHSLSHTHSLTHTHTRTHIPRHAGARPCPSCCAQWQKSQTPDPALLVGIFRSIAIICVISMRQVCQSPNQRKKKARSKWCRYCLFRMARVRVR